MVRVRARPEHDGHLEGDDGSRDRDDESQADQVSGLLLRALDDAEGWPVGQLGELRIDASQRILPVLVCAFHLGRAHRQRLAHGANGAEAVPAPGRALEQLGVDADGEHAMGTAQIAVAEGLVRVQERTALLEAALRVDDLLTDDAAAPAFHLVSLLDHRQPLSHGTHSATSLPVHSPVASDNVQHIQGVLRHMVCEAVIAAV